ncbi:TetR/AcrR family transcriptional regulator [Nocardioides yefusunii]|uniref:TetR/AcrR family transcriptional regulator n=1 Tax=Nocardioides yefusunii TaxID=2500546 RepID=A0ABW1QW89_9ACTN|nr:TetR/AcrR family transcriptional regulator [Nocardioides yefusunii]
MSTRDRIVEAAFSLFEEQGFEATTVEDVAERAGVGRTTFFRHFRAKEDAVLPDHELVVAAVDARLAQDDALATRVAAAARLVLEHYLEEGERARVRYRLSTSVPAIRRSEAAGQRAYQRTFKTAIKAELGSAVEARLEAELVANAVITAHNFVLRRWLRGETEDPFTEFDAAMVRATQPLHPERLATHHPDAHAVEAARRALPVLEELLPALRRLSDH